MYDFTLFVVFPYFAVTTAIWVSIYRYRTDRFSYSSQSSQFLENRLLSWGSAPWHYAILTILAAHLIALLFPKSWATFIAEPTRLYILEVTGQALAWTAGFALCVLIYRRITNPRARSVTSVADWILLVLLLSQVGLGFWVALFYRWGAEWYIYTSVPWMISLLTFQPDISTVTTLPWVAKWHLLGGFMLVAAFPFTRLVHSVTFPFRYLWRPPQVVVWNRRLTRTK